MAPLAWLALYFLVNLSNVNNGRHGTVVRYFATSNALCVIKPVACCQSSNTMHLNTSDVRKLKCTNYREML